MPRLDFWPSRDAINKVTFHVRHEHRHADAREALSERLQRDGLAGAGGARDQAVAIGERGKKLEVRGFRFCDEQRFGHDWPWLRQTAE